MEGLLTKQNSSKEWKERYGKLINNYLMTYKPINKRPSTEVKEAIDLNTVDSVSINKENVLEIFISSGNYSKTYYYILIEIILIYLLYTYIFQ